jgi:hypothetical protein
MKTFKQFLEEATTHQRIKTRLANLINLHRDSPEKVKEYKEMLKTYIQKEKPSSPDYEGREVARKDKNLIPTGRESSFPELSGVPTVTQNPKKIRKQRALGEIQ